MLKIKLLSIILCLTIISCSKDNKEVQNENQVQNELNIETVDYQIVSTENQSRKAMGKKPLSEHEISELKNLPTNKKVLYKIVLSKDVNENNIKPSIEKIISNITSQDSDIDEIILWLYSDIDLAKSTYDLGTAIWAPFGKLGNVDTEIAENNNRKKYTIDYQLRKNIDEYLKLKLEDVDKFGLTTTQRKQVFKEIVKAEDNAFEHNGSEQEKILKKNKEIIIKKYNITIDQLQDIGNEGLDKFWPID